MDLMRAMMNRDTFRELEGVSDRLNRMLSWRTIPDIGQDESLALADWAPLVDVMETDMDFQIRAELPGVEKKDVKLSFEGRVLLISGHRDQEKEEKGKRYHRVERAYGRFARSFTVPDSVDGQKVTAELKNGMLTVRLPKSEKARPKSIEVQVT